MNAKTKKWGIIGAVAAVVLIIIFMAVKPNHLSGKYTSDIGSSIVFKGDKFQEFQGGTKTDNKGTYEISDNEIKLEPSGNGSTMKAELAKDKESFTVESTGNEFADLFARDIKYTKQ